MAERRKTLRKKSFLSGCVQFNKRRGAIDCIIRDLSDHGARIIFSDTVSVPDRLDLYIPQKGQTLRAHVQWRHGDEIGLAFPEVIGKEATPTGAEAISLAHRVAALETEMACLRDIVQRFKREQSRRDDAA